MSPNGTGIQQRKEKRMPFRKAGTAAKRKVVAKKVAKPPVKATRGAGKK
jgi:hypothetical protein